MADQEPQGGGSVSELASFGEELRREREIRGISLKEIADATKISRRFLDAIEKNDHKTLPAPVFTRGFVREYARYLGLNSEEMVNRYNFAAANDDRIEKPPHIEKYPQTPPRDISPRPPRKRGIPSVRADANKIALVLLVIALGAAAYWAIEYRRLESERIDASTTMAATTPPPALEPEPEASEQAPADDSKLRLTIVALDNAWVTIDADGKTVLNRELEPGQTETLEADEAFRIRTVGNAAGLRLTLNGTPVPPLGGVGEVIRNRTLDRAALERLRER
jgi:cytoskeleton protein RodZ